MDHSTRHPPIVETAPAPHLRLLWADEGATQAFAERLALQADIADVFIALQGDLGAGKTTLVRHLLRALGVQGRIKSPTYAVVEPHHIDSRQPPLPAWHFDFYRFNDPREWEDAGFRDIFASPGLKLAEWPDKAGALLPTPDLHIVIDTQADAQRAVTLTAGTTTGQRLLSGLAAPETRQ
ncbi:tRNA threonylcarbamoyladenosine biosynthesis protein TsaE [Pseudorhodoferax sp. Leaf267]|nr:tRNA threonylcarbamoyladenosine biosynthesis protein TsaE [Pseudorhodoferax sp. Leaf267]